MTYDAKPFGPAQEGRDELPVLIGAGAGAPEALLLLGRPAAGRVRVREWSGQNWSAPPRDRDVDTAALLGEIERAQQAGRRLNQSLYAVRLWLSGAAG
ncbi:MAG TPA: hypothetical protein VEA99_00470 [Gemmatimonadaceae bacterium]|nr:hypothetical protein [Gemmatimonadaceae bacterium]